ncbi:hypothetical protein [Aureibacter tunicatorum]|uniref:Uncharacterized protein n=1 Tax=Aureibacter tunicatorum TaxID=866807 RepID=A0AAE3XPW2_9BACT|nr:hypothetical protein [Aureibacter tunicatorum]MDR6239864.1 hypothetical protein [Aureibacter tunicatorum]BDD04339.1 hypothetical protein AUTU_18220 [Aureibacter tunicatorum]
MSKDNLITRNAKDLNRLLSHSRSEFEVVVFSGSINQIEEKYIQRKHSVKEFQLSGKGYASEDIKDAIIHGESVDEIVKRKNNPVKLFQFPNLETLQIDHDSQLSTELLTAIGNHANFKKLVISTPSQEQQQWLLEQVDISLFERWIDNAQQIDLMPVGSLTIEFQGELCDELRSRCEHIIDYLNEPYPKVGIPLGLEEAQEQLESVVSAKEKLKLFHLFPHILSWKWSEDEKVLLDKALRHCLMNQVFNAEGSDYALMEGIMKRKKYSALLYLIFDQVLRLNLRIVDYESLAITQYFRKANSIIVDFIVNEDNSYMTLSLEHFYYPMNYKSLTFLNIGNKYHAQDFSDFHNMEEIRIESENLGNPFFGFHPKLKKVIIKDSQLNNFPESLCSTPVESIVLQMSTISLPAQIKNMKSLKFFQWISNESLPITERLKFNDQIVIKGFVKKYPLRKAQKSKNEFQDSLFSDELSTQLDAIKQIGTHDKWEEWIWHLLVIAKVSKYAEAREEARHIINMFCTTEHFLKQLEKNDVLLKENYNGLKVNNIFSEFPLVSQIECLEYAYRITGEELILWKKAELEMLSEEIKDPVVEII